VHPKCKFFWGPAGGAYSTPPDPLAGGEGAHCPLPKNTSSALSLQECPTQDKFLATPMLLAPKFPIQYHRLSLQEAHFLMSLGRLRRMDFFTGPQSVKSYGYLITKQES